MAKIYGHKWTSNYGQADDGTWSSGLSGVTPKQLAAGLETCIKQNFEWPPSLPEFRGLCLTGGESINLVSAQDAFLSGVPENSPSYPMFCLAKQEIGSFDWARRAPGGHVEKRFCYAYDVLCKRFLNGESFESPVPVAIEQAPTPYEEPPRREDDERNRPEYASDETFSRHLKELAVSLG